MFIRRHFQLERIQVSAKNKWIGDCAQQACKVFVVSRQVERRKRRRNRAASKSLPAAKRALILEAKELEEEANKVIGVASQSMESPRSIRRSSSTPGKDSLQEKIKELYNYLKEYTDSNCRVLSAPFMKLPSKSDYPDYYRVIKQPMDLQMIFRNRRRYESLDDAISHFKLVFDNAMKYNMEESQIYRDAKVLEVATQNWRPSIIKDFNETPQLPRMCG